MAFLHGIETVNATVAGQTFTVVKSGVIGLLGIAPTGPVAGTSERAALCDFRRRYRPRLPNDRVTT